MALLKSFNIERPASFKQVSLSSHVPDVISPEGVSTDHLLPHTELKPSAVPPCRSIILLGVYSRWLLTYTYQYETGTLFRQRNVHPSSVLRG